jgi:hypothetical protein
MTTPQIRGKTPFGSMAVDGSLPNQAAWLKQAKGSIEIGPSDVPEPGEGEVLIRVRWDNTTPWIRGISCLRG